MGIYRLVYAADCGIRRPIFGSATGIPGLIMDKTGINVHILRTKVFSGGGIVL